MSWPRKAAAIFVLSSCLIYLIGLGAVSALLWTSADQWWPATFLSFAPLWALAAPLILLVPLALIFHRWSIITLAAAAAVLVWPILGLRITLHSTPADEHAPFIRVVTCNMHRGQLNAAEFRAYLDELRPDVVALQDWTSKDQPKLFPPETWNTRRDGELFIASRFPFIETESITLNEPPPVKFSIRLGAAAHYRLLTPLGAVSLINLHLSSPHAALDGMRGFDRTLPEQLTYNSHCRELESATIEQFAEKLTDPVLIMGDFNTPVESILYRRYWDHLSNAFSVVGTGFGTTHFSTSSSLRIDHILYGDAWQAKACWIGPAVGSPHHPLVADLQPGADWPLFGPSADANR
ncbi:MAG TPA: endonuclease/exonuclease/phosphatase family protein [Tepidisphaeraceae bacterium]